MVLNCISYKFSFKKKAITRTSSPKDGSSRKVKATLNKRRK